jgi:hypothetical protein
MFMKSFLSVCLIVFSICLGVSTQSPAQTIALTDASISAAIEKGSKESPDRVGLQLVDKQQLFSNMLDPKHATSGFSLVLYTPATWVEYQAAVYHHLMKQFKVSDVTEDMRRNVIRITVEANTPDHVTASGMQSASSVDHVVIQDLTRTTAVQPTSEQPMDQMVASAISSQFHMHGQVAEFDTGEVLKIRGANGDGEFFVTVIAPKYKRDFKVKAKHFSKL